MKIENAEATFTRIDDFTALNGSSFMTTVDISPDVLHSRFGEPDPSDGYKTSMEWAFEDEEGNAVSLYDWKSTSLYSPELPLPGTVRNSDLPHRFHIGGKNYEVAHKFADWLLSEGV